ncbi:MAG: transglutaminase-like domain-containing protein [Alistipes sp.]|nr:transglutaminase-like domain-containing protein [Alistipes sp.]
MKRIIAVLLAIAALCSSFSGADHFITDPALRRQVENDFTGRMAYIGTETSDNLLRLAADPAITTAEKEALWFLLAYCPLCDLADCEPEYFLRQVRGAFRAREYFSWGESVPEDVFRHFVLPHRVNNENLDEARDVFFGELRERIGGMSMYDAALEVNHWCHEKVEYRATDARTSSPLALVKTSWGRCGEESAFTATALRAVGIPARQVYTPRWVHTDSNHAWVEV